MGSDLGAPGETNPQLRVFESIPFPCVVGNQGNRPLQTKINMTGYVLER